MSVQPEGVVQPCYLGDGVYGSFDGFNIWLSVGSHEAPKVVALEPEVMKNLIEFGRLINKTFDCRHFPVPD